MTNDEMRELTGAVSDTRPLVGLLYDLLRDAVPAGELKTLIDGSEAISNANPCFFTNGHLARLAQLHADQLGVREGVVGEELSVRMKAITDIWDAAAKSVGVEIDTTRWVPTEALLEITARLKSER